MFLSNVDGVFHSVNGLTKMFLSNVDGVSHPVNGLTKMFLSNVDGVFHSVNGLTDDQLKASDVAPTDDTAGAALVDKEPEPAAMSVDEDLTPADEPKEITDPVGGDSESLSDGEKDATSPQQLQSNPSDTLSQEGGDLGKAEGVSETSDGHTEVSEGDSATATGVPKEEETPTEIK